MAHIMFFSVAARESREPVITQFSLSLWNFRLVLKLLFWTDLRATANNRKRKEKKMEPRFLFRRRRRQPAGKILCKFFGTKSWSDANTACFINYAFCTILHQTKWCPCVWCLLEVDKYRVGVPEARHTIQRDILRHSRQHCRWAIKMSINIVFWVQRCVPIEMSRWSTGVHIVLLNVVIVGCRRINWIQRKRNARGNWYQEFEITTTR